MSAADHRLGSKEASTSSTRLDDNTSLSTSSFDSSSVLDIHANKEEGQQSLPSSLTGYPAASDEMRILSNSTQSSPSQAFQTDLSTDNEETLLNNHSGSPNKRGSRIGFTLSKLHLRHPTNRSSGKRASLDLSPVNGIEGEDVKLEERGRHSMDVGMMMKKGGSRLSSGKMTPMQKEATGDFADFLQAEELKAALQEEEERAIKRDLKAAKHPKKINNTTLGGKGKMKRSASEKKWEQEEEERNNGLKLTPEGPTLEQRGYFPGDLRHHYHHGPSRPHHHTHTSSSSPRAERDRDRDRPPGVIAPLSDSDEHGSNHSEEDHLPWKQKSSPSSSAAASSSWSSSSSSGTSEILDQVVNPSIRSLKSWQSDQTGSMGSLASGGANQKLAKPLLELEELELDSFLKNFGRHTREIRVPSSANFPRKRMPRWEDFKVPPGEAALAAAQGKRVTVLTHVDRGLQMLAASEGQGIPPSRPAPMTVNNDKKKKDKKSKPGEMEAEQSKKNKVTFASGKASKDNEHQSHHHFFHRPPSPEMPFAGLKQRSIEKDEREAKKQEKNKDNQSSVPSVVNVHDDETEWRPSRDEANMDFDEWELLNAEALDEEKEVPEDEKVDGVAWAIAYILALVERYAPEELDNSPDQTYREGKTRSHIERLYLIAPFWERFLVGVRRVYRWDNPSRTSSFMMSYFTLWHLNLLPTAFFCILIFYVCQFRFFPPSASYLHEQVRLRMARGVDADRLAERLRRRSRLDVLEIYKRFVVAYGQDTQLACGDVADFHEKVKNLILWRNTTATWRTLTLLAIVTVLVTFVSSHIIIKTIYAFLGFTFFILLPLQSHYPRFRRPLSPIWWALWGAPTDGQFAIQLLRRRHLERQRLKHPDDIIVGQGEKNRSNSDNGGISGLKNRLLQSSAAHAVAFGSMKPLSEKDGGLVDLRDTKVLDGQITSKPRKLGSFFCQHHGVPGHLHVNTTMLYFVALHSHVNKEGKGRKTCKTSLGDVSGLVKTKSIQLFVWSSSGLQVIRKNKGSLFFSNMPHRDNAFNLLLAVGSEVWNKV